MQVLHTPQDAARWLAGRVSGQLHCDSRRVGAGDGFIAWPGAATDGRRHVPDARARGAAACLVEAEGVEAFALDAESAAGGASADGLACYPGLKSATGPIAAAYYEQPTDTLRVLAVTGTNGKTSTAWWLAQALSRAWPAGCGLVGTLGDRKSTRLNSSHQI